MAAARSSGRNAGLSESDEIIKTARTFIGLLGKPTFSAASKAGLINFLEEVIKSRQQVTNMNQPDAMTEQGQAGIANQLNAIEQKLNELKVVTTTNSAKVDELKTTITTSSERTYVQVAATVAAPNPSVRIMRRQQAEEAKRERAKFQFTLSIKSVSEDAKKELGLQHPKEITARCQHAIDKANLVSTPKV